MELFEKVIKPNETSDELLDKANFYRNDPHAAKIKPEYLVFKEKCAQLVENKSLISEASLEKEQSLIAEDETQNGKHTLSECDNNDDPKPKKIKKEETKKKDRVSLTRQRDLKICPSVSRCVECEFGSACKYNHDLKAWLENKPKDAGAACFMYRTYGKCSYGISCRFSGDHVVSKDDKFENLIDEEKTKNNKPVQLFNILTSDLKGKLWKRKYDFKQSDKILDTVNKFMSSNRSASNIKYNNNKGTVQRKETNNENEKATVDQKTGFVSDEDLIKLRNVEKKKIDWKNKLYLAPLTTVGNLPFRRICKEFGADVTCSEMALGTNLLSGQASEWALLKRHESEDIFGIQLAGAYADTLTKTCQMINDNCSADFVDLNCGCPIDLIFKKGSGCALMTRLDQLQRIVRSMDLALDIPVTVKIRTGIKEDVFIAHDIIPELKNWGASMITLHGRTRQQRYSKLADWDYIEKCAGICDPVPLFGCGDILSHHDYYNHVLDSKISGCMIARGALYKPWIFTEIKEKRDWDISAMERFDVLRKFVNYGLEHWGSDSQGVENTRRFLLEWLSFFYRYIPVGIMESLPQRINLRPPQFFCRNELEGLMASPNCSDWIKISEMLLGPVPENFHFMPKHKANAY